MFNVIFLVFFVLEFPLVSCDSFVRINFHRGPGCVTGAEFHLAWIIPLPSECNSFPFNMFGRFSLGFDKKRISFTAFDDPYCNEVNHTKSFNSSLTECRMYAGVLSYNVSWITSLPVNTSESMEYFVQNNFKDNECREPFDAIDGIKGQFSDYQSFSTNRTQQVIFEYQDYCASWMQYNPMQYCGPDWLLEEIYNCEIKKPIGWKYYHAYEGTCLKFQDIEFGDPVFNYAPSLQKYCLTGDEFEKQFEDVVPEKSLGTYGEMIFSFDDHCGSSFYTYNLVLEHCSRRQRSYAQEDRVVVVTYLDDDCTDVIVLGVSWRDYNRPSFYDTCFFFTTDALGYDWYIQLSYKDNVNFPNQVTRITTDKVPCGGNMETLKKDRIFREVFSISNDQCLNGYIFGEMVFTDMKSMRARCENGQLTGRNYSQGPICYGLSQPLSSMDICYEYSGEYHHITCIPMYCGEYSQYQDEVCSRHGSCVVKDESLQPYCQCDRGYAGEPNTKGIVDNCNYTFCYGVRSDKYDVCHGRGYCAKHDVCRCDGWVIGVQCETPILWIALIISSVIVGFFWCVFMLFYCCCVAICACCVLGLGTLSFGTISSITGLQFLRLTKYEQLEDLDLLISEQKLEKDSTVAHLRINKLLFEIPYEEVKIEKMIGSGGSDAMVFSALWKKQKCAFKCFKTRMICSNQDRFDQFEAEVNLLVNLNHPHIIRFYGASMKPPRVGIVMEYCENGELLNFVIMKREQMGMPYPFKQKIRMIREIISALEYVHSRNIIHRDLKVENVLVDRSERCKLMDFGISRVVSENDSAQKTKRIGTNVYMAPEIMSGKYDEKCDVFSFSILCWVLLTEQDKPYGGSNFQIEFRVASDPDCRPSLETLEESLAPFVDSSDWLCQVLSRCWAHEKEKRFSFHELDEIFEKEEFPEKEEGTKILLEDENDNVADYGAINKEE